MRANRKIVSLLAAGAIGLGTAAARADVVIIANPGTQVAVADVASTPLGVTVVQKY